MLHTDCLFRETEMFRYVKVEIVILDACKVS